MRQGKLLHKLAGAAMGFIMACYAIAEAARDVSTWGLPTWGWYLIGMAALVVFGTFIVVGFWQENNRLRLLQKEGAWDRGREELINFRKAYANCVDLPRMLHELHTTSASHMQCQTMTIDQFRELVGSGRGRIDWVSLALLAFLYYTPIMRRMFQGLIIGRELTLLENLNAILFERHLGTIEISRQEPYKTQYEQIMEYTIPLPPKLTAKVNRFIAISNAVNCITLFRAEQPFWKDLRHIPASVKNTLPYLTSNITTAMTNLRADIARDIEAFLMANEEMR